MTKDLDQKKNLDLKRYEISENTEFGNDKWKNYTIFDEYWYSMQAGINSKNKEDIFKHYLIKGEFLGFSPSPYFDASYYLEKYPDVAASGIGAFEHFSRYGEIEKRSPHPLIDLGWYSKVYELSKQRPLQFYIAEGWRLDHQTHPAFWAKWYAQRNAVDGDPLLHYLTDYRALSLSPNPIFSDETYRRSIEIDRRMRSLVHYLKGGYRSKAVFCRIFDKAHFARSAEQAGYESKFEDEMSSFLLSPIGVDPHPLFSREYYRRQIGGKVDGNELAMFMAGSSLEYDPHPLFSMRYYILQRPDVAIHGINPLEHYVSSGWREPSATHPLFDANEYRKINPDVGEHDVNPLIHYIEFGFREGRLFFTPVVPIYTAERLESRNKVDPRPIIDKGRKDGAIALNKGVFLHAFYPDIVEKMVRDINRIPAPCTVYISTDGPDKAFAIERICLKSLSHPFEIRITPNRGRDIAPFLVGFRDRLQAVDLALHLHTKRSKHYSRGFDEWRQYLVDTNIGSSSHIAEILSLFDDEMVGAVAPVDFEPIDPLVQWGGNLPRVDALVRMMTRDSIRVSASNILELPTGSMFWFRTDAIKPLLDLRLDYLHFDPEHGQVDGTLAHAIERSLFYAVEIAGYRWLRQRGDKKGIRIAPQRKILPTRSPIDPISARIPETTMFTVERSDVERPRLNLLIPTAERSRAYAGVSEALRIFFGSWEKLRDQFDCRIIGTDIPFSNQLIPDMSGGIRALNADDPTCPVIYVDGTKRFHRPLSVRKRDIFFGAAWWNAHQAKDIIAQQSEEFSTIKSKFLYLVQDYECGFYPWSTKSALAEATYLDRDACVPIFNTQLLADFFKQNGYLSDGLVYLPPMNEKIASKVDFSKRREKKLLIYMRPSAQRNALEFADGVVFNACQQDAAFWQDWRFLAIGEDFKAELNTRSGRIESLGRLTLEDYAYHLSTALVGISLMISPHPSYPPLEMAASGIRVLTNSYMRKDLSKLHTNIRSFDVFDPQRVATMLKDVALEAMENPSDRGMPLVDWFFGGKTNLEELLERIASEVITIDRDRRASHETDDMLID